MSMQPGDLFQTALENLGRRKVRTILTAMGVIVGILTIVTMVSLGVGVQREVRRQFSQVGLENIFVSPGRAEDEFFSQFGRPAPATPITPDVVASWQQLPGVAAVTPTLSMAGITSLLEVNGQVLPVRVSGPALFSNPLLRPPQALAGSLTLPEGGGSMVLSRGALRGVAEPAAVVGQTLDVVLQSPRGEQQRFALTVVGVNDSREPAVEVRVDDQAAMRTWWFNDPQLLEREGYDQVVVRAASLADATRLVPLLRDQGFEVQSLELILDAANRVFAVINLMLGSVGGLALFVASLGIVNTMLMAIYERTREIGTLKAIGASRSDIRNLFMIEAGLIGLLGGVVGVISGWLVGIGLNRLIDWYIAREGLPLDGVFFVVPWWLAVAAMAFAMAIGIAAGLYPAMRAARLDPLIALRYE